MNYRQLVLMVAVFCAPGSCAYAPPTYDVPPILANRDEVAKQLQSLGATLEAQVLLQVQVDREGIPEDVRVVRGSGDRHLDALAVWAGRQMRFTPARYRGQPVEASVRVPVTFALPPQITQQPELLDTQAVTKIMESDYAELRGSARVNVQVGTLGAIRDSKDLVAETAELREAVSPLLPQLRFSPALANDRTVAAWVILIFEFAGAESRVRIEPPEEPA